MPSSSSHGSTVARKPIAPKLTANTGTPRAGERAQRGEDRAVAAEHDREVGVAAPGRPGSTAPGHERRASRSRPAAAAPRRPASAASSAIRRSAGAGVVRARLWLKTVIERVASRLHPSRRGLEVLDARRRGRPRPARRSSRGCRPARAAPRTRSRAPPQPELLARVRGHRHERRAAVVRRAHHAALADALAPDLELRLDQGQAVEARRRAASTAGSTLVSEMKETSATIRSGAKGSSPGSSGGRCGARSPSRAGPGAASSAARRRRRRARPPPRRRAAAGSR